MGEVRSGGTELAGQRNSRSATNVKAVIACKVVKPLEVPLLF